MNSLFELLKQCNYISVNVCKYFTHRRVHNASKYWLIVDRLGSFIRKDRKTETGTNQKI